MKRTMILLALLVAGCGFNGHSPTSPVRARSGSATARAAAFTPDAWVFRCRNLGSYPDTTLGLAPTDLPGDTAAVAFHPELILKGLTGHAITETDAEGNVEAYLYPFELFPAGSRFHKYGVTGTLLCADVNGSGVGALFQLHTNNTLAFAGQLLPNTEEARNLTFRKYGAQLVVGETDGLSWITGIHLTLPGKQEVWLSHAGH